MFVVGGTAEYPEYSWLEISSAGDAPTDNSLITSLVGTDEEPIVLFNLTEGLYVIKGKIRFYPSATTGAIMTRYWDDINNVELDKETETLISVTSKTSLTSNILIPFGTCENDNIYITSGYYNSYMMYSTVSIGEGSYGQAVYNIGDYATTEYVRSETKSVEEKFSTIKPIININNPTSATTFKYVNTLIGNTNNATKELYFGKQIGEELQFMPVKSQQIVPTLVFDKNITSLTLEPQQYYNLGWFMYQNNGSYIDSGNITVASNENGVVYLISDNYSNTLYSLENGWTPLTENDYPNVYNITQFYKQVKNPEINEVYVVDYYDTPVSSFLGKYAVGEKVEPVKLALYEDLANAGGIKTLTSPVRIWNLDDGIYLLPENCSIQYFGATNTTTTFSLGSQTKGILKVQSAYNTTAQSTSNKILNKFFEIDASNSYLVKTKIIGRVVADRGYYNKLMDGSLNTNITLARQYMWFNPNDTMASNRNYRLVGAHEQFTGNDMRESQNCYINNNELYSNNKKVVTETGAVVNEYLGIKNTDGTIDQIKHINNNFQITSASGQSLLNIDEQLETVTMFNEKVMRGNDFELNELGTTLTIYLD
jgi:hypothetical protein